jgi:hypothetical protein
VSTSTSVGLSTSAAQGAYIPAAGETQARNLVRSIWQLAKGHTNSKGTFTLSSTGATLLSVPHVNCAPNSIVSWMPVTADAAAQMATVFLLSSNVTTGAFSVSQATNTSTSSIFNYVLHG